MSQPIASSPDSRDSRDSPDSRDSRDFRDFRAPEKDVPDPVVGLKLASVILAQKDVDVNDVGVNDVTANDVTVNDVAVNQDRLLRTAQSLLAAHPRASVVAIDELGRFVPMPPAVALGEQQVITGPNTALELVIPADLPAVLQAWDAARTQGFGVCDVRPISDPASSMTLTFVVLDSAYGITLGIFVHREVASLHTSLGKESLFNPRVGTVRKSSRAEYLEVDAAIEFIMGYTAEELLGQSDMELVHPDDRNPALAAWMDMLAAAGRSRRTRVRQRHKDGHWIWFEITNTNRLNDPSERCVVAEMIDISQEMTAHEQLRTREELLRILTESLPVGVLQIDLTDTVVHQNSRVQQILGHERPIELADILAAVDAADLPALQAAAHDVLHAGGDADLEVGVRHQQGRQLRCRLNLRTLSDTHGDAYGAVICIEDVTVSAGLRAQLQERATYDALTGCHNRASILAQLDRALADARVEQSGAAVVFIDLDHFKAVNDTQGHDAGDALLVAVARCLTGALRDHDSVGRLGGDEFLVVGTQVDTAAKALELGERLGAALSSKVARPASDHPVASIGVAWSSGVANGAGESVDSASIVKQADQAMYESKRDGHGRAAFFTDQPA